MVNGYDILILSKFFGDMLILAEFFGDIVISRPLLRGPTKGLKVQVLHFYFTDYITLHLIPSGSAHNESDITCKTSNKITCSQGHEKSVEKNNLCFPDSLEY